MTSEQPRQLDLNVLAVLHNAAGRWSVLVADVSGPRPRIRDTRRFDADDANSINSWLDSQQVGEVLAVVPGSAVVCRTCTLPDLDDNELAQGLALQAEAHLHGIASEHRTAMAVLPEFEGESNRSGLLIAWPENAIVEFPELDRPVFVTADVASIAALLNGSRPEQPVVWVDRHSDALALAVTHPNGVAFRVTRERAVGESEMVRGVQRALAETALNVGHSGQYVEAMNENIAAHLGSLTADTATLVLPADVKAAVNDRVEGAGADNQWWSQFGIAVGALLARTGPLHNLTRMIDTPPTTAPTIVHRVVDQLSNPRTTVKVVVVAVLLLAISPLLFNGMRLLMLNVRYSDIDDKMAQVERAQQSLAMYRELEEQAWPMTKLLGDIANCTPLGIELEMVRVRQGQFFTVKGSASSNDGVSAMENIALMEQQLRDTGIFTEVRFGWGDPTAGGRLEFDLNARIVRPYHRARYDVAQDFGAWPHEARRNGDPAPDETTRTAAAEKPEDTGDDDTETAPANALANANTNPGERMTTGMLQNNAARTPTEPNDTSRPSRPGSSRFSQGGSRDDRDLSNVTERSESAIDPNAVPELLSEATISTLSRDETMTQLGKVASAKKGVRDDKELKAELDAQFKLLMAHLTKLKN